MSNVSIRGTDGAIPKYDPEGLWKQWNYDEIYFGDEARNKHVPKVNDYIRNLQTRKTYRVVFLNDLLIPTLAEENESGDASSSMVLIGDGLQPVTMRAFLDTFKLPFELSIDSRHRVYGSGNTYARLFKGTDVTNTGKVISAVFSGSTYVDDKIPLELVVYDDHTNLAEKCVPTFNTMENLPDGEVVTLIIYNAQNSVTSRTACIIERTAFIRPVNASQKYITGVTLDSSFITGNDPYVINYPLNVPIGSLNVTGVIHYSDGSERRLPVDGTKFSLYGIEKFVATRPGQKIPLILNYRLDDGEVAYTGVSADGKRIPVPYTLVTTLENGIYSPILFGYPRWVAAQSKYTMQWWLMDLNRDTIFDATSAVQYNESSDVFDGTKFNSLQFLSIRVKLSEISQALPQWIHTQTLYVKLLNPTLQTNNVPKWEVSQENVIGSFYGADLSARVTTINQNFFTVNIGNNIATLNEWFDKLYFASKPVFSLYRESAAPLPTHFTIMNDSNNEQTFPISNWNTPFNIFTNIQGHSNLIIRWERHVGTTVLKLATTEIPINFIN